MDSALLRVFFGRSMHDVRSQKASRRQFGIVDLFPNFIEEVNSLLQPEHRLTVKKGSLLCTELRILALIRLGITDSPKIARALNISVRTAYCYRNRLRYKAICPPEEFETRICEIGLYK